MNSFDILKQIGVFRKYKKSYSTKEQLIIIKEFRKKLRKNL
jgi:hypothetical protein